MADGVVVRVSTAIVDPEPFIARTAASPPVGAFVGTIEGGPMQEALETGAAVVGIGPIGERLTLSATDVWPVRGADVPRGALALLPFLGPIVAGLAALGVGLGDRALVSGRGLTARLAAVAMEQMTERTPARLAPPREGAAGGSGGAAEVDVLVDTTGDTAWWGHVLLQVGKEGRALLLIPPGPQIHSFDFLPRIHRGSLSLAVRRVPSRGDPSAAAALLSRMLADGALAPADVLGGITVGHAPAEGSPPLHRVPEGMGLAVQFDTTGDHA